MLPICGEGIQSCFAEYFYVVTVSVDAGAEEGFAHLNDVI